jgi:hypothetical protein
VSSELAIPDAAVVVGKVGKPDRVVRDGKVAVVYSPGFGAGWCSWNEELSPFEPGIVAYVLAGRRDELTTELVEELTGVKDCYTGGACDLEVMWLPVGTPFRIEEYDGSETVITVAEMPYQA